MKFSNLFFQNDYMPTIHQWLSAYGESHTNSTNKTIHWICVPTIFFSIVGLLYGVGLPFQIAGIQLNLAMVIMLLVVMYYFFLSKTLWIGMFFFWNTLPIDLLSISGKWMDAPLEVLPAAICSRMGCSVLWASDRG